MTNICPYCGLSPADTNDHIFSRFLGGRKTIRACARCNNAIFGKGFEAVVKANLAPLMVGLAINGLKPTTQIRWQKARKDPDTGWEYDLNPNGMFSLSDDQIERDAENRISRIVIRDDPKLAKRHAASLIKKGLASDVEERLIREPFNGPLPVRLHFGEEIRRLVVKMCVATSQFELADGKHDVLDATTRAYLLGGGSPSLPIPVKMAFSSYGALDHLRPPLSHVVYIEGDTVYGRCYGVVQFYGAIQFYVTLNSQYAGKDFARIGFVNRHLDQERFEVMHPLCLSEAPEILSTGKLPEQEQIWFTKLNDQVRALFGKNPLLFGSPDRPRLSA